MVRFTAELHPIKGGGFYVEPPAKLIEKAGWKYGQRLRGNVAGIELRSSLTKYSGVFHVGVPAAIVRELDVEPGTRLHVEIEIDPDPPGERVPPDLEQAIQKSPRARAGWDRLSPAHRREHVKHVIEAKKAETRDRRIASTIATLEKG
jgi:hypothetical protein